MRRPFSLLLSLLAVFLRPSLSISVFLSSYLSSRFYLVESRSFVYAGIQLVLSSSTNDLALPAPFSVRLNPARSRILLVVPRTRRDRLIDSPKPVSELAAFQLSALRATRANFASGNSRNFKRQGSNFLPSGTIRGNVLEITIS